jgi:hypothetical protein
MPVRRFQALPKTALIPGLYLVSGHITEEVYHAFPGYASVYDGGISVRVFSSRAIPLHAAAQTFGRLAAPIASRQLFGEEFPFG